MPNEKKEEKGKTIEDLQKELDDYKKENERLLKEAKEKYEKDVIDLKKRLLEKELSDTKNVDEEPISEDEKIVTWEDIKKNIKEI